jgi:hypothetical protein
MNDERLKFLINAIERMNGPNNPHNFLIPLHVDLLLHLFQAILPQPFLLKPILKFLYLLIVLLKLSLGEPLKLLLTVELLLLIVAQYFC